MKKWLKHEVSPEFTLALARLQWKMRRFFAILGIIAMLGSLLPNIQQTYAYTLPEATTNEVSSTPVEYPTTTDEDFDISSVALLGEVDSLRTESTKTFQRVDGSFVVAMYADAVHYQKNGKWEDINNELAFDSEDDSFSSQANQFTVKFPKSLEENKSVKLSMGDYSISWSILGISKTNIEVADPAIKTNNMKELTGINQEVTYANVMNGVDVQYVLTGTKVKENIVLDYFIQDFSMTFEYSVKNLSLVEKNGTYSFVNVNGDVVFDFSNLYAIDSKGEATDQIRIDVSQVKKDTYQVVLSLDDEWAKDAEYPITIDPTISSASQTINIYDTYVYQGSPTTNYYSSTYMILSGTSSVSYFEGLLYFVIPSSVMNAQITYAYLSLSKGSTSTQGRTIELYKNDSSFTSSSVTWNTRPTFSSEMTDYHIVGTSNEYIFDITKATREWQQTGNAITTGFTIKDKFNYGATNYVRSKEYSVATQRPVIEIGYINPTGIKDYWTYSSQEIGSAGTGYVSNYTGLMNLVRNDLSFKTDRQSISLSFAYNILDRGINVGYGKGWNISYNSTLGYDSTLGLNYTIDYTGNKVYYHSTTNDSRYQPTGPMTYNSFEAEDGSGNLYIQELENNIQISQFILSPDNQKFFYSSDGFLDSISDTKTNNSITILRDSVNKNLVTRITDSAGNYIQLHYVQLGSAGYFVDYSTLNLIQDDASFTIPEKTLYDYDISGTSYMLSTVEHQKNYDSNDVMTTDDTVSYAYDSSVRLTSVDQDGLNNVVYTYSTANKVIEIQSYYDSYPIADFFIDYDFQVTTITDQNDDYVIYKFDNYGHTVNMLDSDGNANVFEYLNPYKVYVDENGDIVPLPFELTDATPVYSVNHHKVTESTPQTTIFNPVNNHSFEYFPLGSEWPFVIDSGSGNYAVTQDSDNPLYGQYSVRLNVQSGLSAHLEQSVILDGGPYTLIGYVKNSSPSGQVYIDIVNESYGGGIEYVSNDGEWTKIEITFGVTSNDSTVKIILGSQGAGWAYFDNIQIVSGFNDTRLNMLDNPSMENHGALQTQASGWYMGDSNVYRSDISSLTDNLYGSVLGDWAIKLNGAGTSTRYAMTSIPDFIDSSPRADYGQFVIGAWAYSQGTPTSFSTSDSSDSYDRYMRIRVDILSSLQTIGTPEYDAALLKTGYVYFDSSVEGWQYAHSVISTPDGNVGWVNVFLEYKGEGSVYYDGLQIYFEQNKTEFEYNQYGNITKKVTSSGDVTEYLYDEEKDYSSKPNQINLSDDTTVSLSEDASTRVDGVTYNNVSSTPTYNTYGQTTMLKVGDETTYFTSSTSYLHRSQYTSTTTNEFGNVTHYYNDTITGLLEAISNAKGEDTHYLYDNEGKLIEVISTGDYINDDEEDAHAKAEYVYDSQDRLWKIVIDTNLFYSICYDDQGRMAQVTVNNQPLMTYSYEMDGSYYTERLSEQTYGNGDAIKFVYNDKNQIETIQFKESTGSYADKFSYEYDQFGRLSVYITIINNEVETSEYYTYDSSGRLTQVVDESGNITKYIYDDSGNLTSLYFEIDGKSSTTNYTYNECFLYDENDACIQTSSLYDNTEYDSASGFDVLKDYHYEDEALYRLEYINLTWGSLNIQQNFVYSGNTTRINQITYDLYDGENPDGINYKYTYTYDSLGNIIHEYYYEATTLKLYRNYEYDALNQLVVEDSRDYNYGSTTLSATNYTKYYYYDSHGNRTDVKTFLYGQNDIITPTAPSYYQSNSGLYDAYMLYNGNKTYQNMYLLNVGQTPSLSFSYYDALYDPDHEYPISGMTTTMTYDNLNTSETGYYYRQYTATDGVYYTISFRIIFKVGTPLPYDRIPQEHLHYNYSSNWEDQLLSYGEIEYINGVPQTEATLQQYTYDNQGNPTEITHFVYNGTTYDRAYLSWSGRELKTITVMQGYSTPLYKITYKYNDQGYRTQKAFYSYSGYTPVLTETITYELIDDKVIYETNGTYGILFTYDYDGTLISFNYDSNVNDQYAGSEYFYIRNQMGDISHIVDSSGAVVVHYIYDAYGNITYQTPNQTIGDINPYRYRGYRYDEELSWYYLNSRYYTPEMGRFISSDILLSKNGDVLSSNMYAYAKNNPVSYIDETGKLFKKILNAILSIVATAATLAYVAYEIVSGNVSANDVVQDLKNLDFANDDPTKIQSSNIISFYKGSFVIIQDDIVPTSFSYNNTIFLHKSHVSNPDVINHEWGHTIQQKILGLTDYTAFIAIPSMVSCTMNMSSRDYFSMPWERTADIFGGVNRGNYKQGSGEIAWGYLGIAIIL